MTTKVQQIPVSQGDERRTDKRAKFVELAEKRTINAIRAVRTIGKLGNKAHYEYDERDVKKIISALNKEVEAFKVKMTSSRTQETIDFKL